MQTGPRVRLGSTDIDVSRYCIGTGTHGWSGKSDQTQRGDGWLADVLVRGVELGVNFWDLADEYGSHAEGRRALESVDREAIVITTKTTCTDGPECAAAIQRFLDELGTDYLDIVLLHCQAAADWPARSAGAMEALTAAKEAGQIRAVGMSSHGLDALKTAAEHPWVDVILARLNYAGVHMDGTPAEVLPLIHRALDAGKGIIGMKVLGCGDLVEDPRKAITWAFASGRVHALTIGPTADGQMEECAALVAES
jgi:1-deoxyxylulose-5-phosphate synthase